MGAGARKCGQRGWTLLAAIAAVFATLPGPAVAADADDSPGPSQPVPDPSEPTEAPRLLTNADGSRVKLDVATGVDDFSGMVAWPRGRRVYQFLPNAIQAIDLDSLEHVGRSTFPNEIFHTTAPPLAAVDDEGGRLFVAYRTSDPSPTCVRVVIGRGCFGGIFVVDAATLQIIRTIPWRGVSTDGTIGAPWLWAIEWSPPRAVDDRGQLHLVIVDLATETVFLNPDSVSPQRVANQVWVAAWDPDLPGISAYGWRARVSACTNMPPGSHAHDTTNANGTSHAFTVFRPADRSRPYLYVGCYGSGGASVVARLTLDESGSANPVVRQESFIGPGYSMRMLGDPTAERLLIETSLAGGVNWWVFDGRASGFVGAIGIGRYSNLSRFDTAMGLDPITGRHYVLGPDIDEAESSGPYGPARGGLFVADLRSRNVSQAVRFPALASIFEPSSDFPDGLKTPGVSHGRTPMVVDPGDVVAGRPRRIFYRPNGTADHWLIIEDRYPLAPTGGDEGGDILASADVEEAEGITEAVFTGEARGYGFRTILVRGLMAATNPDPGRTGDTDASWDQLIGPDALTWNENLWQFLPGEVQSVREERHRSDVGCLRRNREIVLGLVGTTDPTAESEIARLSNDGANAAAQGSWADADTEADYREPVSRCSIVTDWEELAAMLGLAAAEPALESASSGPASCLDARDDDRSAHPTFNGFAAEVACRPGRSVTASSRAGFLEAGPIRVGNVASMFQITRDPEGGGIRVEMTSTVRGLEILDDLGVPLARIDQISATARSWATGRHQSEAESWQDVNCDATRKAGVCYVTRFTDVWIAPVGDFPGFSCGHCPSSQQVGEALRAALGSRFIVRTPVLDEHLAAGTWDGGQAGIQKRAAESFSDKNLNRDNLSLVVPALELIRIADSRASEGAGRQVYQFAGVQTQANYTIFCFLEVIGTQCTQRPGTVVVNVADPSGAPLAGAVLELHSDEDGDGSLGAADRLLDGRTCATGTDGTCRFEDLPPQPYVLHEASAPPGYAPADDVPIALGPGQTATVNVTNVRDAAGIAITLVDLANEPLAGGTFEVHADDGDGALGGAADRRVATCVTGPTGACQYDTDGLATGLSVRTGGSAPVLEVPVGAYVVRQTAAAQGYEPADDIAFALTSVGQFADVRVRNAPVSPPAPPDDAPADTVPPPSPPAGSTTVPVDPTAGEGDAVFEEVVITEGGGFAPAPSVTFDAPVAPPPAMAPIVAGPSAPVVERVLQMPVEALRLMVRSPRHAAAFALVLALFAGAIGGASRRRVMLDVLSS